MAEIQTVADIEGSVAQLNTYLGTSIVSTYFLLRIVVRITLPFRAACVRTPTPNSPAPAPKYGLSPNDAK